MKGLPIMRNHHCNIARSVRTLFVLAFLNPSITQAQPAATESTNLLLTAAGNPDIQGVWDFRSVTPLQRPPELSDKEFLTQEEISELEARALAGQIDRPPRAGDTGAYNQFWMDRGTAVSQTRRTSLIIDPPNGRL